MDEKTIHTYNQMAKEYDEETIDLWDQFPRTFFDIFTERVQGSVLDVGSGPGRDGLLFKEKGLDVTCLDASEAMVELCKEKGLRAIAGDFTTMPFEHDLFDGVWAYTSLLHIPKKDVSKAFGEIQRVLKNNGILGLGLIEGDTEGYRESSGANMPRWFSFYTKEEVEQLLAKHGFNVLYFEQFTIRSRNYLNFIAQKMG